MFEWAKMRGWVDVNPAKFRLNDYMAQPYHTVQHVASMDWHEAPAFMSKLQAIKTVSSLCVQWIMLTAARPMQGCGARWDEIDLERKLWVIPGSRMKQKRDHVVPLSSQALDVLAKLRRLGRTGPWLFPARKTHYHSQTIREKFIPVDVSLHGFRSTFANWCVEQGYSVQLIDLSLSHLVGVTRSFIRSNMVEQRAPLMQAWADFLDSAPPEPDLAERITANPIIRKSEAAEERGGR